MIGFLPATKRQMRRLWGATVLVLRDPNQSPRLDACVRNP